MPPQQDKRVLYVGGLSEEATEETLHAAFVPFGDVKEVNIPRDFAGQTNDANRGFAFVTFELENDAAEAWDAHDLGFERDELAEFAPLRLDALRDRIAEDEKELELMHEHAALTIEHAKVKKMLLADKDHELREYEYQWGVAKANVAASEGELMVVEEEVAVLRGLVLQMHKHLADASHAASVSRARSAAASSRHAHGKTSRHPRASS